MIHDYRQNLSEKQQQFTMITERRIQTAKHRKQYYDEDKRRKTEDHMKRWDEFRDFRITTVDDYNRARNRCTYAFKMSKLVSIFFKIKQTY